MGTYYRHIRTERAEVPYSFQCEHCGQESGLRRAVIVGPKATYSSNFDTLSPDREEMLRRQAHNNLVRKMKEIHKDAVEKKIFPKDFNDQCPFCYKYQSWAVPLLKKKMYKEPKVCLIVGTIIAMIVVTCCYDIDTGALPMAAGIFVAGAVAALGCLVWNVMKIQQKIKETASGVQRFPVIEWDAVRNLLNEQL